MGWGDGLVFEVLIVHARGRNLEVQNPWKNMEDVTFTSDFQEEDRRILRAFSVASPVESTSYRIKERLYLKNRTVKLPQRMHCSRQGSRFSFHQ